MQNTPRDNGPGENSPRDNNPGEGPDEWLDLAVVIVDRHQTRWSPEIDDWNAATLLACTSEDPADWSEIAAVWPRYAAGPSAEFADSLPLAVGELDSVLSHLCPDEGWLVLDLQHCRIFSSSGYGDVQRDGCFGMGPDNGFGPKLRMGVHVPPWWEIHNEAQPQDVSQPRNSKICRPSPRRDVLWGPALADGLAERLLVLYRSDEWKQRGASDDEGARYPFTVRVHRDWLMTPRADLDGRIPRESLHGGIDWLGRIIDAQQWNVTDERGPIAIPRDLSRYDDAPMGRSEVCLYFDACREMIEDGWQWLVDHDDAITGVDSQTAVRRLAGVLNTIQHEWMRAPFEGGSPPVAIIQSERDRVPQLAGDGEEGHMIDCDCPICQMMAEGAFGPCFLSFDGHHLELDDEFAFSLCETREQWEMQQQEFAEMSAAIDQGMAEQVEKERTEPADELASVWQGSYVADELPGDPLGHLGISFRLADIIGDMKARSAAQADIDALNQAFGVYRHAGQEQRSKATERFKNTLEKMAQRHPFLISRAADLQSTLDDLLRRPTPADIGDDPGF